MGTGNVRAKPGTAPLSIPIPTPTPIICRQCWRSSAAVAVRYSSSLALSYVSASFGVGVGIGIGIDHACRTENRGQAKLKGKNRGRARARKDAEMGETGDRRTLEKGKNRSPPLRLGGKGRIQGLFQVVPPLMINVYFQHVIALDDPNQGSASAIGSWFTQIIVKTTIYCVFFCLTTR